MIDRAKSILWTEKFSDFPRLLSAFGRFHLLMTFGQMRGGILGGEEGRHELFFKRFFEAALDGRFIIAIF